MGRAPIFIEPRLLNKVRVKTLMSHHTLSNEMQYVYRILWH
jgi:hypothetical protein